MSRELNIDSKHSFSDDSAKDHFSFGDNWKSYAQGIAETQINEAIRGLGVLLDGAELKGKSFLDIGCGSGIHSLAAIKLGAEKVAGFDIDLDSVETTKKVLAEFAPNFSPDIRQANILNPETLDNKSKYDIVYSWGVLHHTGDMYQAIENAMQFVKDDGLFIIAIYNKTPLCGAWKIEKAFYSKLPKILRFPITCIYAFFHIIAMLMVNKNPYRYIANYSDARGMNYWHDLIDWLGGYPYESAYPDEINDFFSRHGFDNILMKNTKPDRSGGIFGTGCAEYVFRKKVANDTGE